MTDLIVKVLINAAAVWVAVQVVPDRPGGQPSASADSFDGR